MTHKLGAKVGLSLGDDFKPLDLVKAFHSWIQRKALPGTLVDVADYAHVVQGPRVLLVGLEQDWGLDTSRREAGLYYLRKAPQEGSLEEQWSLALERALRACALLEQENLPGLSIEAGKLRLFANDKLALPNEEATYQKLEPSFMEMGRKLFGQDPEPQREKDPKERFSVLLRGPENAGVETLLERLKS